MRVYGQESEAERDRRTRRAPRGRQKQPEHDRAGHERGGRRDRCGDIGRDDDPHDRGQDRPQRRVWVDVDKATIHGLRRRHARVAEDVRPVDPIDRHALEHRLRGAGDERAFVVDLVVEHEHATDEDDRDAKDHCLHDRHHAR